MLMTHALPPEIRLDQLTKDTTEAFETLWTKAENAANQRELTAYQAIHTQVADLIGLALPASGELARCTCPACWTCDTVFDAAQAHLHMDGTIERVQCPACWDDHPRTGDE